MDVLVLKNVTPKALRDLKKRLRAIGTGGRSTFHSALREATLQVEAENRFRVTMEKFALAAQHAVLNELTAVKVMRLDEHPGDLISGYKSFPVSTELLSGVARQVYDALRKKGFVVSVVKIGIGLSPHTWSLEVYL